MITWLELINEIGNEDLIRLYLQNKISSLELAREIGNSNMDLVIEYKKQEHKQTY